MNMNNNNNNSSSSSKKIDNKIKQMGYISLTHYYFSNNTFMNEEDIYYLQRSLIQNKKINVPKYILSLLNKPNVLKDEAFILYDYKVIIEYDLRDYNIIRFRFIDSNIDIYKTRNVNYPYCPYSYEITKKEFIKDRYKLFEL